MFPISTNEQIVWFQIPMEDPVRVTTANSGNDLSQEIAHGRQGQANPIGNLIGRLELIHVGFQIVGDEFKH
jgi:hypothetical protein